MKALTYEQRLTAIFETERKAKAAAARKLDTAKEECKHMADQAQAEAVLHSAEQAHAAELSAVEEKARSAYTTLRAELAEKVRKASLVNPDDVEPLALELLESGVMKADDFARWRSTTVRTRQCCGLSRSMRGKVCTPPLARP